MMFSHVPVSSSYKDISHIGLGTTLIQQELILNFTASAKTLFPVKLHSQILGVRPLTYLSWGDTVQPSICLEGQIEEIQHISHGGGKYVLSIY